MDRTKPKSISYSLRERCTILLYQVADKHNIAPVLITAHIKSPLADRARKEVMVRMIEELGMRRWQVAEAFGRDLRRVRASVLEPARVSLYENKRGTVTPRAQRRKVPKPLPSLPVVLVGNQLAWDFTDCSKKEEPPVKPFRLGHWIREIPEDVVSKLGDAERKMLRKRLRMQLARL